MYRFVSLLALVACKPDEKALPALLEPVDATVVGVGAGTGLGVGSAALPVVGRNRLSAPVEAGTLTLASVATVDPASLVPDATGWGEATVSGSEGRYEVTVSGSAGATTAAVFLTGAHAPTFEYPALDGLGGADGVVVAGGGVLAADGTQLAWAAARGGPPVVVGTTDGAVDGLLTVTLDGDGVPDALAWSEDALLVLRGRSAGGVSFAAGWTALGGAVTAALARDLDGDSLVDIGVLMETEDGATVLWYLAEPEGGWTLAEALELDYDAWSFSAEDLDEDGEAEVTVLAADGSILRYARFEGSWTRSGGVAYDLELAAGSRLAPSVDLDGDGLDELVIHGPVGDGDEANAFVIAAGSSNTIYQLFAPGAGLPGSVRLVSAALGDGHSLFLSTDRGLSRATWNADGATFGVFDHGLTPTALPIGAGDLTGDGLADVVFGGDVPVVYVGDQVVDDPATADVDETLPWKPLSPDTTVIDLGLAVPPAAVDRDGDGLVDLVALTANDEGLSLTVYEGRAGATPGFDNAGATLLGDATALAVARCGGTVHALWRTAAGDTRHQRHTVGASGGPIAQGAATTVTGELLACGDFGDGFDAAVVTRSTGQVMLLAADGDQGDGGSLGAVQAVAAADPDGDGVHTLTGCAGAGCSVGAGDLDGDGLDDVATLDAGVLAVAFGAGGAATLPATGTLAVQDADGDGRADLTVADGGTVRIFRAVGGALTPGVASHVYRPAAGPPVLGDLDGDDVPDLLLLGRDDDPAADPDWEGTVIHASGVRPG